MGVMNSLLKGVLIFVITGLIGIFINYLYSMAAFDIFIKGEYYNHPKTNTTNVRLHFLNQGFMAIEDLDFILGNDCNMGWYAPKILSPSECSLTESIYLAGICEKLGVGGKVELRTKTITNTPASNCNITISYHVSWPGLFFRLSSHGSLKKSSEPINYGDEPPVTVVLDRPKFNLSLEIIPIKNFVYSGGGRALLYLSYISNKSQSYTLTGEWFNSNTTFDATTVIRDIYSRQTFTLNENLLWSHYQWGWFYPSEDVKHIGFQAIFKGEDGIDIQKNISFEVIHNLDLTQYLTNDSIVQFDENITDFALDYIFISNTTSDYSQAELLLDVTRQHIDIPKEVNQRLDYDESEIDAKTVFYKKEGTASEFNALYILFLRSVGIPAKIEYIERDGKNYPYTSVYIKDREWINVDVYNKSIIFGDCFINCEKQPDVILS